MRLVVKKADSIVNEFQFTKGPINIGRHADSQIFLPERTVSRHHAVLFSTQDGKWMVEDMDSVNKTYLNDEPIHKANIKTGDTLRIEGFTIEINLEDETIADEPINLEDTLTTAAYDSSDTCIKDPLAPKIVIRRTNTEHAPDIRLPVERTKDFAEATEAICKANSLDDMLQVLLRICLKQFKAFHAWGALRNQPTGPMIAHVGKSQDRTPVQMDNLRLKDKISQAIDKKQFLLIPRIPPKNKEPAIHSALIAPIAGQGGCFGVLYVDNDMAHERYDISDLDYLMLLAIHTSTIVENF